jgi:hypothetical protein
LTCWFHVLQNVQRKLSKVAPESNKKASKRKVDSIENSISQASQMTDTQMTTESLTAAEIEQQIRNLHHSQSPHIFRLLWSVLQRVWKNDSNAKISEWGQIFAEQYVDREATNKWYIGCDMGSDDDIPLALTNNIVESFNHSFKNAVNIKVDINIFFKETVPDYMHYLTHVSNTKRSQSHVTIPKNQELKFIKEHKIPDLIVEKAKGIISSSNINTYYDESRQAVYINSNIYMSLPVTSERVEIFENALNGNLIISDETSWGEVLQMTSSLHKVSIIEFVCQETNTNLRRCRCTCKMYKKSSFICSHVLFCYYKLKLIDVYARATTLKSDNQSSSKCIPVRINNSNGFILSCKRLQKMSDSKLIEVHFDKPSDPEEREVKLIAVSECRKGIHDFAMWSQHALTPNKRRKK